MNVKPPNTPMRNRTTDAIIRDFARDLYCSEFTKLYIFVPMLGFGGVWTCGFGGSDFFGCDGWGRVLNLIDFSCLVERKAMLCILFFSNSSSRILRLASRSASLRHL